MNPVERNRSAVVAGVGLPLVASSLAPAANAEELSPPRLIADQSLIAPLPAEATSGAARALVELELNAEGGVRSAKVIEVADAASEEIAALTEAALAHAAKLRFEPALRDGAPTAASIRVEVRFAEVEAEEEAEVAPDAGTGAGAEAVPLPVPPHSHAHSHSHSHAHEHFGAHARVVNGTAPAPSASASALDIDIGALRDVPRDEAEDYLTLSPGLVLQNHSGEGHTSAIYLRGFAAGEGEDLEVLVDGVPINEP